MDIAAIDEGLEQGDDHALFFFITFLETGGMSLNPTLGVIYSHPHPIYVCMYVCMYICMPWTTDCPPNKHALELFHPDHVYGEDRATLHTLLQVHQVARRLEIPELAPAALIEMTRQTYRIHREVEGVHDQRHGPG